MNEARSVKWIRLAQMIVVGVALMTLAVVVGLYLGNLVTSPNWQNAIRLVGLGGVMAVIVMNPSAGLMLWLILEPFTRFWYLTIRMPLGVPDLSLGRLAVALLTVVWLAQLAVGKRRIRRFSMVEIFMGAFCIMVLPSVVAGFAGITRTGQQLFERFIAPFLVFVLAKNLYEEKTGLDWLAAALAVIGFYLSFMVFYEQVTGQPLFYTLGRTLTYSRSLRKIVSLLGNPAFLGTVLGMIAPFALFKFVRARSSYGRAFFGLLFMATLLGNFFCYNRGAWLALAAGLLILMLFEREYRRVLLPVLLIAILVGVVRWQTIAESALVTERLTNVSSITFRLTMLEASKKMLREHLLFGVGFENFGYYYLLYGGHWETLAYDTPTPHNSYLLVLTTMGLVSFIPYVLIFLSMFVGMGALFRSAKRDKRVDRALLVAGWAVIAVYTVSAATVDLFINAFSSLVFFAITGTIMGYVSWLRVALRAHPRPALPDAGGVAQRGGRDDKPATAQDGVAGA